MRPLATIARFVGIFYHSKMDLHWIALDVPTPPNYGGAVDMLYKVMALKRLGVRVHMHAFAYDGRVPDARLTAACASIQLYARAKNPLGLLSVLPYMSWSRRSRALLARLRQDNFPILLEGIHTASLLQQDPHLGPRCIVRTHNVESEYYQSLAQDEPKWMRRLFLWSEALKLAWSEPRLLRLAAGVAAISPHDSARISAWVGTKAVTLVGPFHGMKLEVPPGLGTFALFHANLAVPENHHAAMSLALAIPDDFPMHLCIAGRKPRAELQAICAERSIHLIADPEDEAMDSLVRDAAVHLLPGSRGDGVKLKVLRALLHGRHVVASPQLLGTGPLVPLCHLAQTPADFFDLAQNLALRPVTEAEIALRTEVIGRYFDDDHNAKVLLDWISSRTA